MESETRSKKKRGEKRGPKELWTCRDWYVWESTHVQRQSYVDFECAQCPDRDDCSGPEKYFRAEE